MLGEKSLLAFKMKPWHESKINVLVGQWGDTKSQVVRNALGLAAEKILLGELNFHVC